jgi:hypothetical protein
MPIPTSTTSPGRTPMPSRSCDAGAGDITGRHARFRGFPRCLRNWRYGCVSRFASQKPIGRAHLQRGRSAPMPTSSWRESARDTARRGGRAPLPSRHARRHLTTLQLKSLRGAWLVNAGGGGGPLAPVPVGCRRRILQLDWIATAETRVIRAKGSRIPSGLAGGVLVYGGLIHRTVARAVVSAGEAPRPCCRRALLRRSLDWGGTSRGRGLPNRFGPG